MADGRGGKRAGAGRKPGAVTQAKRTLAAKAKVHADDMLTVLVGIAQDHMAPHASRVSAASAVLDRGYGKPPQSIDHSGEVDMGGNTLRALLDKIGTDGPRL